jgi:hypothetical protein
VSIDFPRVHESGELDPRPISGRQELYESVVGDAVWAAGDRL